MYAGSDPSSESMRDSYSSCWVECTVPVNTRSQLASYAWTNLMREPITCKNTVLMCVSGVSHWLSKILGGDWPGGLPHLPHQLPAFRVSCAEFLLKSTLICLCLALTVSCLYL